MNDLIIYNTPDGRSSISLYAKDGSVWLNQNQLAELFATSKQNIGQHVSSILKGSELTASSVVKNYFTTAADGKKYKVDFYSLEMIRAVGFRVRGVRGTQFRQWANRNLTEYLRKGFIMDDERLKNPDGRPDYFDELLNRIRDIRASEKRFYQKIRDLLTLSSDYDNTDKATQMFFAETQNKLLFAVTGKTAAEIIVNRADAQKVNMGLTSWKGAIVRKQDIITAKNYLTEDEIDTLNRLVVIFLETAELTVKERKDLTMMFWKENVDLLLNYQNKKILHGSGSISKAEMESQVEKIYKHFDQKRKKYDALISDQNDLEEIKAIESKVKKRME
jgi:hypothetical protein